MGLPISQLIVFFPMLLPVWEQQPLREADLSPSRYPIVVDEQDVPHLRQGLRYGNRELRGTIYRHLREMDIPSSRQLLASSLRTETDLRLVGTILQQLSLCGTMPKVDMPLLQSRLDDTDPDVRYWAIRLAGHIDSFPASALANLAANGPTSRLRLAASQALSDRGAKLPLATLRPLWKHADPVVRAAALATALRVGGASGRRVGIPSQALADTVPVRYALAAALPEAAPADAAALAPLLAKDAHPSVRASTALFLGAKRDPSHSGILVALTRDPDPEVRRAAAESLAEYPEPPARDALIALLRDPRTLVRRQAEDSLVAMHPSCAVDQAVGKLLAYRTEYVRYHVYRLLGRLDSRGFGEAIAEGLDTEEEPVNIAAAVFALGCFEARFAADAIYAHEKHADPGVRAAVAHALGQLAVPKTYPAIHRLAFDPEENVRQEAILAMGRTADGNAFNDTLLNVLKTVATEKMSCANRAAAAWSIGRVRPVSRVNIGRLVVQATTPVVPGEMGEMLFEDDYTLASCVFSLAQVARHDQAFLPRFEEVRKAYAKVYTKDEPTNGAINASPEVREAGRQALAYYQSVTPEPARRPTREKSYDFGLYER